VTLPDTEITVALRDLLSAEWTPGNTRLSDAPRVHTGWYDTGSSGQQVTVTNPEGGVVNGGDTAATGGGAGGASQVRAGTVLVNCWAGSREDCRGVGDGGRDVNPKSAAYSMAVEAHRIVQSSADGRDTDGDGVPEYPALGADTARRVVDTDDGTATYRYEVTVRYTSTSYVGLS
jgi:hypothetical protein